MLRNVRHLEESSIRESEKSESLWTLLPPTQEQAFYLSKWAIAPGNPIHMPSVITIWSGWHLLPFERRIEGSS